MRMVKTTLNASFALVVIPTVAITVTLSSARHASPLPVFDEHGASSKSVFDGAARYSRFAGRRWPLPTLSVPLCKAPYVRPVVDFIRRNAPFASISAFTCGTGGSCLGHWSVNDAPHCGGGACGDNWYDKFHQDSASGAGYCDGWRVDGDECNGCVCRSVECTIPACAP